MRAREGAGGGGVEGGRRERKTYWRRNGGGGEIYFMFNTQSVVTVLLGRNTRLVASRVTRNRRVWMQVRADGIEGDTSCILD